MTDCRACRVALDFDVTMALRQALVRGLLQACDLLGTALVAEGMETDAEARCLRGIGIRYMQGYLFARPGFETLPEGTFTALAA